MGKHSTTIDARSGAQDHVCSGMWQLAGLNAGGHELYKCDTGGHVLIAPHVAGDHECSGLCAHAFTLEAARAAVAQAGAEIPAMMAALEAAEHQPDETAEPAWRGLRERLEEARAVFYEHAPYSYPTGSSPEEIEDSRRGNARDLADAEETAKRAGAWLDWEPDPDEPGSWQAMLRGYTPDGDATVTLAAMGAIDSPAGSTYARVIGAQLALEAMPQLRAEMEAGS